MYFRVPWDYAGNMSGRQKVRSTFAIIVGFLLLTASARAENMVVVEPPEKPQPQKFWTVEKKVNTGIFAGLIAADAITTQKGLSQGYREGNPIARPFVNMGAPGQAAGAALGFGSGMGVVYILHRTRHYKVERIVMRLLVAGEGAVVANNIARIQ
jgi:hypothetical protein